MGIVSFDAAVALFMINPFERSVLDDYFLEHGYQSQGYFQARVGLQITGKYTNIYASADANEYANANANSDAIADAIADANAFICESENANADAHAFANADADAHADAFREGES